MLGEAILQSDQKVQWALLSGCNTLPNSGVTAVAPSLLRSLPCAGLYFLKFCCSKPMKQRRANDSRQVYSCPKGPRTQIIGF